MSDAFYREGLERLRDSGLSQSDGEGTRERIQHSLRELPLRRARSRRQVGIGLVAVLVSSGALAFYVTARDPGRPTQDASAARPLPVVGSGLPDVPDGAQASGRQVEDPVLPQVGADAHVDADHPAAAQEASKRRSARALRPTKSSAVPRELTSDAPAEAAIEPQQGQSSAATVQNPGEAQDAAHEGELTPTQRALYMTAHRLHFGAPPSTALAAWDAFLAQGPRGPLAVEARYNRGVVLARMGRTEQAREALTPFANGQYGSFRKAAAERLLSGLK